MFYDDSWVGLEPYFPTFTEFGFDGIIKCIFSGYEVRLCAGVDAPVHEVRLHPYLFPVGLGGAPTFPEMEIPKEMLKNTGLRQEEPCSGQKLTGSVWEGTCIC